MKKQTANNIGSKQEQMIQNAFRTGGFSFPETIAEVESFEKSFGTTDVTLPEHLKIPNFIGKGKLHRTETTKTIALHQQNFAVAARGGALKLSNEIHKRMEEDRKKADAKIKKNNSKKK
jgi:hypothetical protein